MILALLACAPDSEGPTPTLEAEPAPIAGRYAVTVAETWEGDCDLHDDATYEAPEQEWTMDPRGDVLIVYPGYWDVLACTLDGLEFSCDDGSWDEGRAHVTRLVEGTFDGDTFAGERVVELDCSGAGCDTLQGMYGRGLEFPCRAEAPIAGTLE